MTASVDFSAGTGRIKKLHGVNRGPFNYHPADADIAPFLAEAGVRVSECR